MKLTAILATSVVVLALSVQAELPAPSEAKPDMAELRPGTTYFGTIHKRSGSMVRGFIIWEPQNGKFIVTQYLGNRHATTRIPSQDVAVLRFRELTDKENKMIEDQNKTNGR